MCKHTYHHFPICGHIANWTFDSCIEFMNSLRDKPAGLILSCKKIEETHDLLRLFNPTLCSQCGCNWQERDMMHDFRNGCGKDNVSIEGLGFSAPIIEMHANTSLGAKIKEPEDVRNDHQDLAKQDRPANPFGGPFRLNPSGAPFWKTSLSPLPPPRLIHVPRPSMSRKNGKRPAPIVTGAYQVENSSFDKLTPTPTPTSSATRTAKRAYSSLSSNQVATDRSTPSPSKTYGIYDWIPVSAHPSGTVPSPSSFNYSPSSIYSADMKGISSVAQISASPLRPSVPRPEEYESFHMTPGDRDRSDAIEMPRPPVDPVMKELRLAFLRLTKG